jgi:hypothetical protein
MAQPNRNSRDFDRSYGRGKVTVIKAVENGGNREPVNAGVALRYL